LCYTFVNNFVLEKRKEKKVISNKANIVFKFLQISCFLRDGPSRFKCLPSVKIGPRKLKSKLSSDSLFWVTGMKQKNYI
jgi:hypothetical protein